MVIEYQYTAAALLYEIVINTGSPRCFSRTIRFFVLFCFSTTSDFTLALLL